MQRLQATSASRRACSAVISRLTMFSYRFCDGQRTLPRYHRITDLKKFPRMTANAWSHLLVILPAILQDAHGILEADVAQV